MPSYPHIDQYRADLQRFVEFGGSDNEQSIRRAFAVCLDSYCRDHREKLALVDELDTGSRNRPDGTVKDSLRMARGYWEAKDTTTIWTPKSRPSSTAATPATTSCLRTPKPPS